MSFEKDKEYYLRHRSDRLAKINEKPNKNKNFQTNFIQADTGPEIKNARTTSSRNDDHSKNTNTMKHRHNLRSSTSQKDN